MKKVKLSVQDMCMIGMFTAIIVIMAQISIPMPMGVPMTMQTFAITLAAIVLGAKNSTISTIVYVLLGAIGVPVYAGFTGGIDKLIGPTGGFLFSFPIMALIIGIGADLYKKNKAWLVAGIIVGTVVNYICGVLWFCFVTWTADSTIAGSLMTGFTACVLPFIPTAIIKAILAVIVGLPVRFRVVSAVCTSTSASN